MCGKYFALLFAVILYYYLLCYCKTESFDSPTTKLLTAIKYGKCFVNELTQCKKIKL